MNETLIMEVSNFEAQAIEWIIEDLEQMGFKWTWTKDHNIQYWR